LTQGIQRQVEVEDVDAWFAEESKRAPLGVLGDQRTNLHLAQAPFPGDACDLLVGVRGADVGVEAGPAGQQRVTPLRMSEASAKNTPVKITNTRSDMH